MSTIALHALHEIINQGIAIGTGINWYSSPRFEIHILIFFWIFFESTSGRRRTPPDSPMILTSSFLFIFSTR